MDVLNSYNKAILGIPVMWLMSWGTHAWSIAIATGGQAGKWDNRNPRSVTHKKKLQDKLPAEQFAKYERAVAASMNSFENLPLYAAAAIIGTVAKLDPKVMDNFALSFIAIRAVYQLVYVQTSKQIYTPLRSVLWISSIILCVRIFVQSAKVLR